MAQTPEQKSSGKSQADAEKAAARSAEAAVTGQQASRRR
jgi:hypothetical protein